MLNPKEAVQLPDHPARFPTAYVADELLIPPDRYDDVAAYNEVLRRDVGLTIIAPSGRNVAGVLVPSDPTRPVVVDAWVALQALRAATVGRRSRLTSDQVAPLSLNHLLIGSSMGGVGGSGGVLHGVPGAVNGNPYPGQEDPDELGYWRRPVQVQMPAVSRTPDGQMVKRRPVIAVLDTGIGQNDWLGVKGAGAPIGGFITADVVLQAEVDNFYPAAPRGFIDDPYTSEPLTGCLATHAGHGLFIFGLIHQYAPDANVLSVRVMHNDGIARSGVISHVLEQLYLRVQDAQDNGRPHLLIDVVSLSLGNYLENDLPTAASNRLTAAIDNLRSRGVVVIASAGNYASSRPFFPAALAGRPADAYPPVVSVGAENPNGSRTLFSNEGPWVSRWRPGAALISTFPRTTNASKNPMWRVATTDGAVRESMEGDDYSTGFAMWSGSSFAAPILAAEVANAVLANPVTGHTKADTLIRAKDVVASLQ
jgi:hypothetical protein